MARDLRRINLNVPADLVDEVDAYAENMNINRTSAINMLLSTALEQKKSIDMMDKILKEIKNAKAK